MRKAQEDDDDDDDDDDDAFAAFAAAAPPAEPWTSPSPFAPAAASPQPGLAAIDVNGFADFAAGGGHDDGFAAFASSVSPSPAPAPADPDTVQDILHAWLGAPPAEAGAATPVAALLPDTRAGDVWVSLSGEPDAQRFQWADSMLALLLTAQLGIVRDRSAPVARPQPAAPPVPPNKKEERRMKE